jgi:hypothetical protein
MPSMLRLAGTVSLQTLSVAALKAALVWPTLSSV